VTFARAALAVLAAITATASLAAGNWLIVVDAAGGGHRIGNPKAKVKLTEFFSYTCPACGRFAQEATNAVDLYIASGKVQVDIRHVVRDPVDLTVAMLANCGAPAKFPRNHAALMLSQPKWLPIAQRATTGQQSRWHHGPGPTRRRAIAADMGLYAIMATRGYERVALDRCLADETLAKRLTDVTAADAAKWNVHAIPSFAIDGMVLSGTSSWGTLQPQIDARL